ncbi:MAG TPA: sarcosine oxidase subunit gamma family protein [Acetobacteraceae bacterium]|jgi:heterotetrameric sarcosine oxidase gamma subunit|nr:sarcosine oxidase subunit gamma family protein [Acetobacteraceae bacterium]
MDDPGTMPVRIRPAESAIRLNIRAATAAAASIGMTIGVLLGTAPCRAVVVRDRTALWLGPDEWLVLAPESETALAQQPLTALGSVVDVSHAYTGIEVSGPRAAWCINAYNALDLDPHAFPIGACTRTLFGKAQIVLWRAEAELFRIEVARSFAPYVWQCLEQACREFLPPPGAC